MITIVDSYISIPSTFCEYLSNKKTHSDILIKIITSDTLKLLMPPNTPFACNPRTKFGDYYVVLFDETLITKINLTYQEQLACILHEIGHIIYKDTIFNDDVCKEQSCDNIAAEAGYTESMMSALCKLSESLELNESHIETRLNNLSSNILFYRPEWTSGKYNETTKTAIYYNLITGMNHFFEGDSADVIGRTLSFKRNEKIHLAEVATDTNTALVSLFPFYKELTSLGLLTTFIYNKEQIYKYRQSTITYKRNHVQEEYKNFIDASIIGNTSNAERDYADKSNTITSVMFELTYRCSEMCIHCYNPGATRNDKEQSKRGDRVELNIDDYKKIIDELDANGLVKVCLSGGDPFSKREIWDLLDYLYKKEIVTDIFTNGIAIHDHVDKLASYYPRLIGVSLYSDIKEDHEAITRINGSYEKTKHFIEECCRLGLPLQIKCCVMKPNVRSYYTVKKVAQENGAIAQFDLNITDSVEGDVCASKKLRIEGNALEILLRDKDLPYYISKSAIETNATMDTDGIMCNAGHTSLCITPEGNVQPCCAFPMKLGNIKNQSIKEIIENSKALLSWRSMRLKDCSECHKNDYCVYCQMCPGNNYIAHGTPLKPAQNNCTLAVARYNLAQRMKNENYDPLHGRTLEQALAELHIEQPLLSRDFTENFRDKEG